MVVDSLPRDPGKEDQQMKRIATALAALAALVLGGGAGISGI